PDEQQHDGRAAPEPELGDHVDVRGADLRDGGDRRGPRQRLLAVAEGGRPDRAGAEPDAMRHALALSLLLFAAAARGDTSRTGSPSTTNNDDSCDIALQPAATLLLPYFEVDLKAPATTTLFTLQNVSPAPVIANVTLWTDWGYAALSFPVHLTGYDVQGITLFDVLRHGVLPPTASR